jgi:hypothetical protein
MLLISGSGRNCGKTTVACKIISEYAERGKIFGLKMTPHFHHTGNKQKVIATGPGFVIYQETDTESGKDTARMLLAGAEAVYFLQCTDSNMEKAFDCLEELLPKKAPVVCESGSLASVYKPALHILVTDNNPDFSKRSYVMNRNMADVILTQGERSFDLLIDQIEYSDNAWTINNTENDQVRKSA